MRTVGWGDRFVDWTDIGDRADEQMRRTRLEAEIVRGALAEVVARDRARFPDVYARVDRIKAGPRPKQKFREVPLDERRIRECAWCGDFFVLESFRQRDLRREVCSIPCDHDLKKWRRRRAG